jgi:hypothetical protein
MKEMLGQEALKLGLRFKGSESGLSLRRGVSSVDRQFSHLTEQRQKFGFWEPGSIRSPVPEAARAPRTEFTLDLQFAQGGRDAGSLGANTQGLKALEQFPNGFPNPKSFRRSIRRLCLPGLAVLDRYPRTEGARGVL